MNQQTIDKIRQIIRDQYGCGDEFVMTSRLDGSIILGDSLDSVELMMHIEEEFDIDFGNGHCWDKWQTVQDVFDSVEASL